MIDLLVENAVIVDVVNQESYRGWLAVAKGRFWLVESGEAPGREELPAIERLDAGGLMVRPGLIDSHMHIESSLVTPRRFAEAALPWGTTTILQDPHEVANVLGANGIRWMIRECSNLPLRVYSAISSCVPATSSNIETPNASISPAEVLDLSREAGVLALGEMMDYHGVLEGNEHLQAMLAAGAQAGLSLEGHIPSLSGRELSRYIAHGIRSDHTLMTPGKLREELRKGLFVMLQEKSLNEDVVAAVKSLPDRSRVLLITDDVMPNRLRNGHLSRIVETAVSLGWEEADALASATLRPASYLGLNDLGAIAPGYHADFILSGPIDQAFPPNRVYVAGRLVARDGRFAAAGLGVTTSPGKQGSAMQAFRARNVPESYFRLTTNSDPVAARIRSIRVNDRDTFTTVEEREAKLVDGIPGDDDLVLGVVIPRADLQGNLLGQGKPVPIAGLGLNSGAYASSFAHDSHNVFVVGRTPRAMREALEAVLAAGGGMAVTPGEGSLPVVLPLPHAGLLSDESIDLVGERFDELETLLRRLGMTAKNPVLLLTILPLTVSPEYKISDKGLVDVERRRVIEVEVGT